MAVPCPPALAASRSCHHGASSRFSPSVTGSGLFITCSEYVGAFFSAVPATASQSAEAHKNQSRSPSTALHHVSEYRMVCS